jgi:hypothetical protein
MACTNVYSKEKEDSCMGSLVGFILLAGFLEGFEGRGLKSVGILSFFGSDFQRVLPDGGECNF